MTDPYKVLGIERGASDEELKKAYRAMSRKYHPDANVNNPDKDKAEEKFKEVQAAYQQILYEKEHPYASSDYGTSGAGRAGYGGYGGQGAPGGQGGYGGQSYGDWSDFWDAFGGFWGSSGSQGGYSGRAQGTSDEEQLKYQAAGNYINSRRYKEALNVLSSILQRSGIWYYYSAMANAGMGNNVIALEHARTATQMEPANQNYRMLLARLQSGSGWYANRQNTYTAPVDGTVGWCVRLCAINVALNLCCGGGYVCC